MKKKVISAFLAFVVTATNIGPVWADQASLEARLSDLEQQIAILKRQIENSKEEAATKAKDAPVITANVKDGFSIKSADDAFKLRVRGLVQADARVFTSTSKEVAGTGDTFLIRRARPIFEGTVGKNFDFYLMPDLAVNATSSSNAQLVDAYIDFKIKNPEIKIRGGKSKVPFGLERLQSDAVANFIEVGLPTNLVPNRDVGFQLLGSLFGESLDYQVGIFNGGPDLASVDTSDTNNDKDVVGRVFVQPFKNQGPEVLKGLGVGVAGSYGHREGTTLSSYRSPGQATVFSYSATGLAADGKHSRISPQAYFYKGSFGILGEYVASTQDLVRGAGIQETFTNKSWQLSSNYVLTGELASYRGITPRTNFDLEKGTWGAFEVTGRYGVLDIDDSVFDRGFASLTSSISKEEAWGAGLNWYPHKNVRLGVNYEHTDFERGAATGNRPSENAIFTRLQLQY